MGKPAARLGDPTTPPHTATLMPGPGEPTVLVGGKPGWRCNVDQAVCPTPIAPPAPAPHGPELCYLGSLSVMYGTQMAARVGDQLIGAGGPNPIVVGEPTVLIGDAAFGLASAANMAEFCADMADIINTWAQLTPEQRRQALHDAINKQLAKSGAPTQSVVGSAAHAPGNAQYNYSSGVIEVSQQQLNSPTLTAQGARQLANAAYHETRHAEQWFLMAQREAAGGASPANIVTSLGVPQSIADAAAANPLNAPSAQQNLADACHQSVYGANGSYRNDVLNNIQSRYGEYRALPEEQDAWAAGDGLPCG